METFLQIVGLALIAACCCLMLRGQASVLAMLLSLLACVVIYAAVFSVLKPVLELIRTIHNMTGLEQAVTSPMMKVVGIGAVSHIISSVCEDAGEKALGQAIEIGCTMMSLYVSLPLLSAVVKLLSELLGGAG